MADLKPCCKITLPFVFDTCVLGIPVKVNIVCCSCGKHVSGLTFERAVKKWNRQGGCGQ